MKSTSSLFFKSIMMMNKTLILIVAFFACATQRPAGKPIEIKGVIKGLPDGKIYLTEAHYWETFLDSADCRNGQFYFKRNLPAGFEPFMVSLCYKRADGTIKQLIYRNHILSNAAGSYAYTSFILEQGPTTIQGDISQPDALLAISAGKETDALYTTQLMDFGGINAPDDKQRKKITDSYQAIIKRYPSSYYLLGRIASNKEQYRPEELNACLALFNKNVLTGKAAQLINAYIKQIGSGKETLPLLSLNAYGGGTLPIYDTNARLNGLICWASWCKPCLDELPELKALYKTFKNQGVHFTGIATDEQPLQWRAAVKQANTPWPQLLIDSTAIGKVKQQLNIADLPTLIFTDHKGTVLMRFVGYSPANKAIYEAFIRGYLGEMEGR
jgi:thiol-disulfide isomerase/thioredoxin